MMKNHPHPGELLREDVLLPLGIEVTDTAERLAMSRTTLSRVIGSGNEGKAIEVRAAKTRVLCFLQERPSGPMPL